MSGSTFPDPIIASPGSSWIPASAEDRDAVLRQLDRMLAHPFFRNSRRYSGLLRYLVERTLRGDRNFKERVLGIEVFGRDPDYDTNEDPVVRVTAGEIRRRIAQYYYESGHEEEIRIELQPGSYSPLFRLSSHASSPVEIQPASVRTSAAQLSEPTEEINEPAPLHHLDISSPAKETRSARKLSAFRVAAILAIVCTAAFAILWNRVGAQTTLDQFWAPVLSSRSPILICLPDLDSIFSENSTNAFSTTPLAQAMTTLGRDYRREKVSFADSVALASLTKLLGSKGAEFRIKRSEDASLEDLKGGPVVLIAGGNNHWTMQFGKQLRFTIERDGDGRYIGDSTNPSSHQWAVSGPDSAPGQVVDYAIISRVFDATTGGLLVTAAGLHHNGTQAAGICLASAECLRQAGKMAGGDWSKGNIQFVIETAVLGNAPGQPRVVAASLR